jgi:hypothetical protein
MKPDQATLGSTCPNCGEWFASAMQIDRETWAKIRVRNGMMERCSHCQHASRFEKGNYSFRSD